MPWPPSHAHSRRPDFPKFLDTIILRLLAKNPADRFYGNARSVINALLTHSPDAFADRSHARGSYL
ncbi:MAG: hypothetical protein HY877_06675, partial [Deltaproteobacteria bacterium]|nr:hypothetical protein [Deltaproteobacteria bacterium]